ncbi:MAG: response regulator [Ardenticatenaceae bacterium]|nr:response regulator [Ardenticatenaceae bacterium]
MIRILIVEDNEMNQEILETRLGFRGYATLVASNGADGVALAKKEKPDIILMDMSLPVLDGWEATRRLKADPETAVIPVIALTAHALAEDLDRCLEAGCDSYETKPVNFNKLLSKIQSLVQESS